MREAKVYLTKRLSCLPNESGDHPVICVITDLPAGQINSFYMEVQDHDEILIRSVYDHPPGQAKDPAEMNEGDPISFDVQDGIHKAVLWNGRKIRQRGYSFDDYAPS